MEPASISSDFLFDPLRDTKPKFDVNLIMKKILKLRHNFLQ